MMKWAKALVAGEAKGHPDPATNCAVLKHELGLWANSKVFGGDKGHLNPGCTSGLMRCSAKQALTEWKMKKVMTCSLHVCNLTMRMCF